MDEDLPRINPSLLRDPDSACPRRLALAHRGQKGDHQARVRWEISDAVAQRVRLAQLDHQRPDPVAFEGVVLTTPEQHRVYDHAVRWYLATFGHRAARAVDLGDAEWRRERPDLGVQLTSRPPLVFEADGGPEVRLLRFAAEQPPSDLLEDPEVRISVLRLAGDIARDTLAVSVTDLIRGEHTAATVRVPDVVDALDAWISHGLEALWELADADRPRIGADCSWCSFVAGCPAHAR